MAAQPDLCKLFNPQSIAVIGASRDSKKIGYITIKNIIDSGYKGNIYPVNPNATSIQELTCYTNLTQVPSTPDLAIISLPANSVLQTLEQCVANNISNIVIFSAGFKEIGEAGAQLEETIKAYAEKNKLNILGPNCLGFINAKNNLNATFALGVKHAGNLRFVSQSGALASSLFDWAESKGLGFSEFITLGNKTVLNENHILEYWLNQDDADTYEPIGMYLESISDGKKFVELTSKLSKRHPIFILKPGKSWEAQRAMMSHTGSIAGADDILDAAFTQAGVIRCNTIEELFNLSCAFSWGVIPKNSSVAVISNAGGPAVITSDAVEQYNLKLAALSEETQKLLEQHLPREASIKNPIDVLGDALADRYGWAMEAILAEPKVDSMLVILTPQVMTEIERTAQKIGELSTKFKKSIVCSFIGGGQTSTGESILNKYKIPTFTYPEQAIYVLAKMLQWHKQLDSPISSIISTRNIDGHTSELIAQSKDFINNIKKSGRTVLNPEEAKQLLAIWNIRIPQSTNINNIDEANDFAKREGWPVVLKISSDKALHKIDIGGVIMNIYSTEQLTEAYSKIQKLDGNVQIQKQVANGIELIVGTKTDMVFGKVLLFGIGGTLVEVLKDKNLAVSPIEPDKIQEIVKKSKVNVLLKGYRGSSSINFGQLYELIAKVAKIAEGVEEILEFEINPVIASKDGIWAIDAKVLLK